MSFQECGQLPMPRVFEIFKYFKAAPPLHLLVRDFVGYKPDGTDFDMEGLMGQLGDVPRTTNVPAHIRNHIESLRSQNAR